MATLEERKAAALAKKAAASERIHKLTPSAEETEIALLEREANEAEEHAKAVESYGHDSIARVRTPGGAILVRRPSSAEYRRFFDVDKVTAANSLAFVRPHVVSDLARFDALIDAYPACIGHCLRACNALAGAEEVQEMGK